MTDYLLPDYNLSCSKLLQSLIVSEYGLRHLEQANLQPEQRWGHRLIALIEFVPVLGQIAMLIEWIVFKALVDSAPKVLDDSPPKREDPIPRNIKLFDGSQEGAAGTARPDQVLRVLERLEAQKESGIEFNRRKVTGNIEGGVCSAMALDFADSFFKLRNLHVKTGQYSPDVFLNCIRNLGRQFAASSEAMRIRQAAFNTIEVRSDAPGIDVARNKVQSLANLHNFRIDHSSREIQMRRVDHRSAVSEEVSQLPDGLYLLRTIEPSNNERLEVAGHSMIYVKNRQEGFFYDPNVGVKYMSHMDHSAELSNALVYCLNQFNTTRARFYRMEPSVSM